MHRKACIYIRCVFCFLIFFTFHNNTFAFFSALVVQSINVEPYNKAFEGIKSSYGNNLKRIIICTYKGDIKEYIEKKKPHIIFAIGEWALSKVLSIKKIPIVYLMVLNPHPFLSVNKNISGVSMLVSPQKRFEYIKKHIPHAKRIGVIYNPKNSAYIYKELFKAAKKNQMSLVAKKVFSSKDVIDAIKEISDNIDLFFMLPDATVISPESLSFMNLFFLKKSIPIVTFSEKYLKLGAFMAIYSDPFDMGFQAGTLAKKIIKGKVKPPIIVWPKARFKINPYVAKNLGLKIDKKKRISPDENNEKNKRISFNN